MPEHFEVRWQVGNETVRSGFQHLTETDHDKAFAEARKFVEDIVVRTRNHSVRPHDFRFRGPKGESVPILVQLEM